jgi:hypothetical protein
VNSERPVPRTLELPAEATRRINAFRSIDITQGTAAHTQAVDEFRALAKWAIANQRLDAVLDAIAACARPADSTSRRIVLPGLWESWQREDRSACPAELVLLAGKCIEDFLTAVSPEFRIIVGLPAAGMEPGWLRREAELIERLSTISSPTDIQARALLYAMWHLHGLIYQPDVRQRGRELLEPQCEQIQSAIRFAPSSLLDPTPGACQTSKSWLELASALVCCYSYVDHSSGTPLIALARAFSADTGKAAHDFTLLIRYWATRNRLIETVLAEKLAFPLTDRGADRGAPLESYRGCDIYIALAGPPAVGKSAFLFASEEAKYTRFPVEVKEYGKGAPATYREAWKRSEHHATAAPSLYAQSAAQHISRFFFFDMAGEDFTELSIRSDSRAREYFRYRRPSALLMMFQLGTDGRLQLDDGLRVYVDTLDLFREEMAATVRSIPIYLCINKIDLGVPQYAPPEGQPMEFLGLVGLHSREDEKKFSSPLPLKISKIVGAARGWTIDDRDVCANVVLTAKVEQHLAGLAPILEICGRNQLTEVFVTYTSCNYRPGASYLSLRQLWSHLTERLVHSTKAHRRDFVAKQFHDRLEKDMTRVRGLRTRLPLNAVPTLEDAVIGKEMNRLPLGLRASAGIVHAQIDDSFEKSSGYAAVRAKLDVYGLNLAVFRTGLFERLRAMLEELGVPSGGVVCEPLARKPRSVERFQLNARESFATTGCRLCDGTLDAAVKGRLDQDLSGISVLDYLLRRAKDVPVDKEAQWASEMAVDLAALTGCAPRYDQFAAKLGEHDPCKFETLKNSLPQLEEVEALGRDLVIALLKLIRACDKTLADNMGTLRRAVRARCFQIILAGYGINEIEASNGESDAASNGESGAASIGALADKLDRLAAIFWSPTRNKSPLWAEIQRDLPRFAQQLTVDRGKSRGDLREASDILQIVARLIKVLENDLKHLSINSEKEGHTGAPDLDIRLYTSKLSIYLHQRAKLLLNERADYLEHSTWLEGVPAVLVKFVSDVLTPDNDGPIFGGPQKADIDEAIEEFLNGTQALVDREAEWE